MSVTESPTRTAGAGPAPGPVSPPRVMGQRHVRRGWVAAGVLWISYYAVLAADKGLGWEPTMWVGAIMVGFMTGFGVAFLVAPPTYGPRLVDADSN